MKFFFTIFTFLAFALLADAQPDNKDLPGDPSRFVAAEKTIFYKLGERILPIRIFQYGDLKNMVCINLHDNENTSVEAAKSVLELNGGTLIKVENNDQRVVRFRLRGVTYGFDPNRIFSRVGIEQTLKENSRTSQWAIEEVEKFTERLLQLIPGNTSCIVALHNNTDEAYSVTTYLSGNQRQHDTKAVHIAGLQDVDDIVFTTDSLLYQKMADNGYNSIWQDNVNVRKDGSLSVYCGEKGIRYINIETQHGKFDQYTEMLGKFLMILAEENKNLTETFHDSRPIITNPQKPVDN